MGFVHVVHGTESLLLTKRTSLPSACLFCIPKSPWHPLLGCNPTLGSTPLMEMKSCVMITTTARRSLHCTISRVVSKLVLFNIKGSTVNQDIFTVTLTSHSHMTDNALKSYSFARPALSSTQFLRTAVTSGTEFYDERWTIIIRWIKYEGRLTLLYSIRFWIDVDSAWPYLSNKLV